MRSTWYSIADTGLFAVAGIWRPTQEWGEAYSMIMVDGCPQMADIHDRMPVVLAPQDWSTWLTAEPEAAFVLCQTCPQSLLVDRTAEPWAKPKAPRLV